MHSENISYGFRRNLLGLKRPGILICLISAGLPLAVLLLKAHGTGNLDLPSFYHALAVMRPEQVGAVALSLITLSGWLLIVRNDWVKEASESYAVRLLAACDAHP